TGCFQQCQMLLLLCLIYSLHSLSFLDSPFLITENMWPRGCVLDCQRGRHRAVCGSNGRLYKSLCAFQRAQCINTQLRLAPRAHCSVQHYITDYVPAAAMFVPRCHQDGHFLPVQCHNQTGYCWCSTPDGKPLSGTSVLHLIPNCTGQIHFIQNEVGEPGPTLDPRKSAGDKPVPQTCERERASLLSQMHSAWQEERFIPECTADGRYSPVQCHTATGYCWCVRVDSGRPLSGTSTVVMWSGHSDLNMLLYSVPTGCPGARKEQFLQSLVRALQLEAEHAGTVDSSRPEEVLQWHFSQLDVDSSGVLSEREARPLRQFLRRRLKPRRCAKKFAQYCDRDGDRGLTLEELRVCQHQAFWWLWKKKKKPTHTEQNNIMFQSPSSNRPLFNDIP
uniref:Thyroglobulin type-1 domain-containing protein n=1 Tax=Seriola lalandi dorsalis TaxID=1841481 RepID=A0A3B4X1K5_SERLL